jgi:hypothetical protein
MSHLLNPGVFNSIVTGSHSSRAVFIDVEQNDAGWFNVVVRGQDKAYVGSTKSGKPAFIWNDANGVHRKFTVSSHDTEVEARQTANDLLAFYRTSETLGERLSREMIDPARRLLPLMIAAFGPKPYLGVGEKCGSYKPIEDKLRRRGDAGK